MIRILFGLILALFVVVPGLASATLTAATYPPVLAFTAGVLAWPQLARTVRRWAR